MNNCVKNLMCIGWMWDLMVDDGELGEHGPVEKHVFYLWFWFVY